MQDNASNCPALFKQLHAGFNNNIQRKQRTYIIACKC